MFTFFSVTIVPVTLLEKVPGQKKSSVKYFIIKLSVKYFKKVLVQILYKTTRGIENVSVTNLKNQISQTLEHVAGSKKTLLHASSEMIILTPPGQILGAVTEKFAGFRTVPKNIYTEKLWLQLQPIRRESEVTELITKTLFCVFKYRFSRQH